MNTIQKFRRRNCVVVLWLFVCLLFPSFHVNAEGTIFHITNLSGQNYINSARWAMPVQAYLVAIDENTYMRFQSAITDNMVVEYYDSNYRLKSSRTIPTELPIFGAFYQYDEHYYIVSGQENLKCSDTVEVFRITKYDKNWNRIAAASLYGANTAYPFEAGNCRLAGDGKYLLIRTCHLMYGGHQANVTIQVDTETMQVTDSYTGIMNTAYGYVSHSFNQFIAVENHRIVAIDHGDAYPRSVVLTKYPTDVSGGSFQSRYCSTTDVFPIAGEIGANDTGVMVNAFDVGARNYVIAGTAKEQSGKYGNTYNIYVTTVNKNTMAVKHKWITNYPASTSGCSNPQLVKLFEDRYVLLWNRGEKRALKLYYAIIDEDGEIQGDIHSCVACLSDCVPIVHQNKLIWYADSGYDLFMNEIDLSNMQYTGKLALEEGAEIKPEDVVLYGPEISDVVEGRGELTATLKVHASADVDMEYSWGVYEDDHWTIIQDWKENDPTLKWYPPNGDYFIRGIARVKEAPKTVIYADERVAVHKMIKGKCQMPYVDPQTGRSGYLIGVESYENPNQSYKYEMLILDCTLLAEGKDAWVYTTGQFPVDQGNAGWTIWTPEYGYYWTLFRVYDENGELLDEACYGFENV